jgi:hypothetical protein
MTRREKEAFPHPHPVEGHQILTRATLEQFSYIPRIQQHEAMCDLFRQRDCQLVFEEKNEHAASLLTWNTNMYDISCAGNAREIHGSPGLEIKSRQHPNMM